jgi:hypothetical protein
MAILNVGNTRWYRLNACSRFIGVGCFPWVAQAPRRKRLQIQCSMPALRLPLSAFRLPPRLSTFNSQPSTDLPIQRTAYANTRFPCRAEAKRRRVHHLTIQRTANTDSRFPCRAEAKRRRVHHLPIQRTAYANTRFGHDVRINLRRRHILVPQQFLHRANVVTIFQKMRRERMSQRVTRRVLCQSGPIYRCLHRPLQTVFVQVMTQNLFAHRIFGHAYRRKDKLPRPLPRRVGMFLFHAFGQRHARSSLPQIFLPANPRPLHLRF